MELTFDDKLAVLRIDDGKANAMGPAFFDALDHAMNRAEAEGARALVLAGRDGMFSGGLDLKLLPTLSKEGFTGFLGQFSRSVLRLHGLPIPTVAALTGHAIAGGAILAYACDKRFMAAGPYKLQLNETALGMAMPAWMIQVARSVVPRHLEAQALLHARAFSPEAALGENLIDGIEIDAGRTLSRAIGAARALGELSMPAYAQTKRRLRGPAIAAALAGLDHDLATLG
ncbi:enoyl-CoA hydratase-related protein [Tistrella bauzanensis]|jgi:enoyl-CoA hydratase|uniref:Enoyl-CoA hydratase-related protein n=1 Tax=Tistrella arctica TaxID=3133430 RepID=A0ABU9YPT1_9PROT